MNDTRQSLEPASLKAVLTAVIAIDFASSVLSLTMLLYIVFFILHYEHREKKALLTLSSFFTPSNATLIAMGIATTPFGLADAFGWLIPNQRESWNAVELIVFSMAETLYIHYSWIRAKDIVHRKSLKSFNAIATMVQAAPALALLQIVLSLALELSTTLHEIVYILFYGVHAIFGVLLLSFDALLLRTFYLYINSTAETRHEIRPEFLIICWHGIASCACTLLLLVLFVAVGFLSSANPAKGLLEAFLTLIAACIYAILCLMKIRIHAAAAARQQTCVVEESKERTALPH